MKKYSFPFFESKSLVPFIKFTTEEGKDIFALVDSGSESTLFDRSLMEECPEVIKSTVALGTISMVGINGKRETTVDGARLSLPATTVDGREGRIGLKAVSDDLSTLSEHVKKVYGSPEKMSLLIGGGALRALHAKIDYAKKVITFSLEEINKTKKAC